MSKTNQPDWGKIAEKFDWWLPQIAPVGKLMLEKLQANPGELVLDIACGTGEPALSLAQSSPDTRIIAIDAADAMVNVAKSKAEKLALGNIQFQTMRGEQLGFPDQHFDAVMSRFGVMFYDDHQQGISEIFRVLKPGGRFAFTVWHTAETMPAMNWNYLVFKDKIPADIWPPIDIACSLGGPGVLDDLLKQAGFSDFTVEKQKVSYEFNSFDQYWDNVEASGMLEIQFNAVSEKMHSHIRKEVAKLAEEYQRDDGLVIPHQYLIAHGVK